MSIEAELKTRSGGCCELCGGSSSPTPLYVQGSPSEIGGDGSETDPAKHVLVCETCRRQIENAAKVDPNHWRCLNESMWSQVPAVQVVAWRMLHRLRSEGWPQELLDTLYLEADVQLWAESGIVREVDSDTPTLDSNRTRLNDGDTVTLIKDLVVKGAGFTAKRGTTVKNISLTSNPEHIEGRVNGTNVVLVANFIKKVT